MKLTKDQWLQIFAAEMKCLGWLVPAEAEEAIYERFNALTPSDAAADVAADVAAIWDVENSE